MGRVEIESRLKQFESLCRERALPLTVQRRDILRAVLERDDHPTADQVYDAVKDGIPGLSLTTVYRVLETLVGLGVIRRLHHPGASSRFDGKVHRHHHLICTKCQKVVDIESPSLDGLELPAGYEKEFELDDYAVHFFGICGACRRAPPG
jgi:Fur family peroxide stress response transcriptional regulator